MSERKGHPLPSLPAEGLFGGLGGSRTGHLVASTRLYSWKGFEASLQEVEMRTEMHEGNKLVEWHSLV